MHREPSVTRRLLTWYLSVAAAYLGVVSVLWWLGVESIYRHPTPFYALYSPVFAAGWILPIVGLGGLGVAALVQRYATAFGRRNPLVISGVVFGGAIAAGYITGLNATTAEHGVGAFSVHLSRHLMVVGFLAIAVCAIAYTLPRLAWTRTPPPARATAWTIVALVAFAFFFPFVVATLRDGWGGITQTFDRVRYEYIKDIGAGGSIRGLFSEYTQFLQVSDFLSMHAKVHPPGPIVLLWILSTVVGRDSLGLSLATMSVGALGVIPLYLWVREMFDKRIALTACMLYVVVPSIVLFTATSADIAFMPFTLTTLFLFWRAITRGSAIYGFLAGVGYGVMSVLSFSLVGVGFFFGLVGIYRMWKLKSFTEVLITAAAMAAGLIAFHVLLWWWSGYDYIENFQLSKAQFDEDQRLLDKMDPRYPAWTFKFWNPMCWFFFAGIPVSVLFIRRLFRSDAAVRGLFLTFLGTLIILDFLYLGRGEGERSAMYVFPFVVVPAAHYLDDVVQRHGTIAPLTATLVFLGAQCWLIESLLYTYW